MPCCGKTIKKLIKAGHIIQGNLLNFADVKYEFTDGRIRTCWGCDEQTWLTKVEYAQWLKANGIEVLKNLHQLEVLPKLPKYELDAQRRNLFCRICKCFVPAAARVKKKKCPLEKW